MADRLLVLQHLDCEGPDLIADLALERGLAVEVFRTDRGDPLPDHTETHGRIALVLGGPISTSDPGHLPWGPAPRHRRWRFGGTSACRCPTVRCQTG